MSLLSENNGQKILHDAYFNKKPAVSGLFLIRLVLLCVMSSSLCVFFADLYGFDANRLAVIGISAGMSAVVYVLASVFPPFSVYGTLFLGACGTVFFLREKVLENTYYFWDYMMLKLNSRLIDTTGLTVNDSYGLADGSFDDEMNKACFLAIIVFAFLCAIAFTFACRTRFHITVPILVSVIISVPSFMAEIAGFYISVIFFAASVFAFEAIWSSYELDSEFVFGNLTSAHFAVKSNERFYKKRTRFFVFSRKLNSDVPRYHKYTSNAVTVLIVSVLVFTGVSYLIPEGKGFDYEEIAEAVSNLGTGIADGVGDVLNKIFGVVDDKGYFSHSSYSDISGSISLDAPSDSSETVLEVILQRDDIPVYLRGDIGVGFNGYEWNGISDAYEKIKDDNGRKYSDILKNFYPEAEYQIFRQVLSVNGYEPDDIMPLQTVSVIYEKNTKVVFQPLAPYELNFKNSDYYDSYGDFVLRTKSSNGYIKTFESLALTPFVTNGDIVSAARWTSISDYFSFPLEMTSAEYIEGMNNYRGYIEKAYTSSDTEEIREFVKLLKQNGIIYDGMPAFRLADAICLYFRDNFVYSLTVDNGKEPLRSFLFETKEGHCALFATAMTLALRECGVPARYVTGYVATGDCSRTAEGYKYILDESRLHAWTEVYFENIGWLPFDPTASVSGYLESGTSEGGYDDSGDITEKTDTEPTVGTEPVEETSVTEEQQSDISGEDDIHEQETEDDTTITPETDKDENDNDAELSPYEPIVSKGENILLVILPYVVIAFVISAVIIILVMFVRSVGRAEKKMIKSFRTCKPHEGVGMMYRFVLALLKREGIEPTFEQFYDFAERVDKDPVMKGSNAFMMDVMPIFEKCEFGSPETSPVSEDERKAVYKFSSVVYSRIMGSYNPIKRFFVKISLFL